MTVPVRRDLLALWGSAAFRASAAEWVRTVLSERGVRLHGGLVPHRLRFWSALFTVDTDAGRCWFKACNPGQAFEAGLADRLGRLVPEHVLAPLAVDEGRGWLLLPDGGPTVRDSGGEQWELLLRQAARMQQALAAHGAALAVAGLPALSPETALAEAIRLVESLARLPAGDPQRVGAARATALRARLERLREPLAALEAPGVPPTLQPNDLSLANAVAAPDGTGYRIFDLGDAFWSHPFAVLQVPLRMATGAWPGPPARGDLLADRLARAYLGEWPQLAPDDVGLLVDAADRLASLQRCESWRRLLAHVDPGRLGVSTPRLVDWIADAAR